MHIISWNVNGIRAWHKKGGMDFILKEKPDIFCLQETKAEKIQLTPELSNPDGYTSFFDHSKTKKGYSGVAIYTKIPPEKVEYEMGNDILDREGRLIGAYYKDFAIFNVYFPNGGGGPERLKFKLEFYDLFLKHIEKLKKKGKKIIFCGDVNTAHTEIDLARPKENADNTGFLPIERAWIDKVLSHGYVDTFRHLNPKEKNKYTYWDMKTFARDRNVGWRIDYFFTTKDILSRVKSVKIHDGIYGSDHCPISLTLK